MVQPAVITFRADLERRTQASEGSLCGGATTWVRGRMDLGSNVWPPASLLAQPRLGNGNDGISIKRVVTYAEGGGSLHFPFPSLRWGPHLWMLGPTGTQAPGGWLLDLFQSLLIPNT